MAIILLRIHGENNGGMDGFAIISKNRNCALNAQINYLYSESQAGGGVTYVHMPNTSYSKNIKYAILILLFTFIVISL